MTNSFGFMGVSLVVLHILGYTDNIGLVVGGSIILLDLYLTRLYYRDIHNIKTLLISLLQYLEANDYIEEYVEEEEDSRGL
jgi:hypothetical protein